MTIVMKIISECPRLQQIGVIFLNIFLGVAPQEPPPPPPVEGDTTITHG